MSLSDESKGFLTRCYLDGREGELWFWGRPDGTAVAHLDRAAIVALEVFDPAHPRHDSVMRNLREAGERVARGAEPWDTPDFCRAQPAPLQGPVYGREPLMHTPDIGGDS